MNKKMKNVFFTVLVLITLISCEKWLDNNVIEYPEVTSKRLDEFINIKSNMDAIDCYDSIKVLKDKDSIKHLFVSGNYYANLEDIDSIMGLYNDFYIDFSNGSDYGVQFSFNSDTIKSIYLNNGIKLSKWPFDTYASVFIERGDSVNSIYPKLVTLKDEYYLDSKIFTFLTKNVDTIFDPNMKDLKLWYLTRLIGNKLNEIDLYFTDGVLDSIISLEIEVVTN